MKCCESGKDVFEPGYDCIIDDGEAVSWDWINEQIARQDIHDEYPECDIEIAEIFRDLVEDAIRYHSATGRYLQIWGELGELYGEVRYNIKRHRPYTAGSDGCMGKDFVEIKTISPEKGTDKIEVKTAGNFNRLLIVKISDDFRFESRMIERGKLIKKKSNKKVYVSWGGTNEHKCESHAEKL